MDTEVPVSSGGLPQRAAYELPSDPRYRIGQMIMVGFRGMNAAEAAPTMGNIAAGNIGAVVVYDVDAETGGPRNIQSRAQVRELATAVKGASEIPVLVAVDAEGGFYHRLKEKYGFGPAIAAAEMGERNDLGFTHSAAGAIASMLAEVGIDMNLAPVLDLLNPSNLAISARRRSFASSPLSVAAHAREFVLAHHEMGVLTAGKHFPGMGGILRPYVSGRGEIIETWSTEELEPYRALIAEGLMDAVLTTRATHMELDPDYPGSLSSKIVNGLLRAEMGFKGVAISDAMEMLAIWDLHGFERGTILAVNAGVDLLLFCNQSGVVPYSDDRAPDAVEVIMRAVERGEITEARIDEACGRILALK